MNITHEMYLGGTLVSLDRTADVLAVRHAEKFDVPMYEVVKGNVTMDMTPNKNKAINFAQARDANVMEVHHGAKKCIAAFA